MAKKPYTYREMSNKRCAVCGKNLKKNLVAKKPDAKLCYICYRAARNASQLEKLAQREERYDR